MSTSWPDWTVSQQSSGAMHGVLLLDAWNSHNRMVSY
jgi:hypothetical protein